MAKIHVVSSAYDATVKAYKVGNECDADLLIFVTRDSYAAKDDQTWHYVDSPYDATTKLFWTDNQYDADLKVFFVDNQYAAGWKKGHSFQNRL